MSKELDCDKLRFLASKLRCLGHLIETQDPNYSQPIDFDEVQRGLSLYINEIVADMIKISKNLEKSIKSS